MGSVVECGGARWRRGSDRRPQLRGVGRERTLDRDATRERPVGGAHFDGGGRELSCTARRYDGEAHGERSPGRDADAGAPVLKRDPFARQCQELDLDGCAVSLHACQAQHPRIGFERVEAFRVGAIVVGEVRAGTDANFKHGTPSERDDPLTKNVNRFRVPEQVHESGIDPSV